MISMFSWYSLIHFVKRFTTRLQRSIVAEKSWQGFPLTARGNAYRQSTLKLSSIIALIAISFLGFNLKGLVAGYLAGIDLENSIHYAKSERLPPF